MLESKAIKPLIQALEDNDTEVIQKSMDALTKFGKVAGDLLLEALKNPNGAVRWRTIEILGQIGDDRAIGPICRALKEDKSYYVRCTAIEILQKYGITAIGSITEATKDQDWNVRWKAIKALESIGDSSSIEPLSLCKYDESRFVREAALKAIETISRKSPA
jgi:hypothetical protein